MIQNLQLSSLENLKKNDTLTIQNINRNFKEISNQLNAIKNDAKIINYDLIDAELNSLFIFNNYYLATNSLKNQNYNKANDLLIEANSIKQTQLVSKLLLIVDSLQVNGYTPLISDIIHFNMVERTPAFGACNNTNNKSIKYCFEKNIKNYLLKNINKNLYNSLGLESGNKTISYYFIITKTGQVSNIKVTANHPTIIDDVQNVLSNIKTMIPGQENNNLANVSYDSSFKIFIGDTVYLSKEAFNNKEKNTSIIIPKNLTIHTADSAPVFPGCENLNGFKLAMCTNEKIDSYISNKTKTLIVSNLNKLNETHHIIKISFIINNAGSVNNIFVDTKHSFVKEEVKNIIKTIPQMKPALFKEIPVSIKYNVTIEYN